MKILHIVHSMEMGGAEVLISHLCRQQVSNGDRPFIHCFRRIGVLGERLRSEGIEVSVSRPGRFARDIDIWKALRRVRPDVVHCHNANAAIHGAPLARLARVKRVIATRHGLVTPGEKPKTEKRFWIAARFCDKVVAVCDVVAGNLARGPRAIPGKIVTVRNGCAPAPAGNSPRPESPGFTLIAVARLVPEKDHATMLRAAALARKELPDLQLWIVGNGPLREPLEALATELELDGCVLFAGERQDTGSWLSAADLFVLSSVSEGLPVSVLEAMAAGLPLLLTNVGGMPEMVALAGGGHIVEKSNPDALARAIVEMAANRQQLSAWGAANQTVYREQLTHQRMSEAYLRLYSA